MQTLRQLYLDGAEEITQESAQPTGRLNSSSCPCSAYELGDSGFSQKTAVDPQNPKPQTLNPENAKPGEPRAPSSLGDPMNHQDASFDVAMYKEVREWPCD